MSTKIKLNGQWVDVATNELVLGASTVRKGSVVLKPNTTAVANVTFADPMPDGDYVVELYGTGTDVITASVAVKTANGFEIHYNNSSSGNARIYYTAFKLITVADAGGASEADLEALKARVTACETKNTTQDTAIAGNTANITANATDISGLKTRMTAAETKNTQQDASIGNLASLGTTAKTSLVAAVNEVITGASRTFTSVPYSGTLYRESDNYFRLTIPIQAPETGMYLAQTSGRATVTASASGSNYALGSCFVAMPGQSLTCLSPASLGSGVQDASLGATSACYITAGSPAYVTYLIESGAASALSVNLNVTMMKIGA